MATQESIIPVIYSLSKKLGSKSSPHPGPVYFILPVLLYVQFCIKISIQAIIDIPCLLFSINLELTIDIFSGISTTSLSLFENEVPI